MLYHINRQALFLSIAKQTWSNHQNVKFGLNTEPGTAQLFEDGRVTWAEEIFGRFAKWNILELGPLEGGHSYMFQNRGADKIISIEANNRAFLK